MSLIEKTTEIGNSIIALIDAKTGGAPDGKTVKSTDGIMSAIGVKESNKDKAIKTWVGTLEEYEALESVDENTLYNITDDVEGEEVFTTTKVNLDGSNYEGSGLQTVVDSNLNSKMTNCITEIPQRIKYTLEDGTLTIKAGSEVIVPNGFEEDGTTPKFDYIIINSDVTPQPRSGSGVAMLSVRRTGAIDSTLLDRCLSGTDFTPTTASLQYNTSTNTVLRYMATVDEYHQASLPIAIVTYTDGSYSSIDRVFNGTGYIGSYIWVDKGVKGLIPNGRNENGTLNNIEMTTEQLFLIVSADTTNVGARGIFVKNGTTEVWVPCTKNTFVGLDKDKPTVISSSLQGLYYATDTNYLYTSPGVSLSSDTRVWEKVIDRLYIGTFETANLSSTVNKISCKVPRVLTESNALEIASYAMPSDKYIDLTLGASGSTYKAPANGWFYVNISAPLNSGGGGFDFINETKGYKKNLFFVNSANVVSRFGIFPVSRGDILNTTYSTGIKGTVNNFRFIYAQGEV